MFWRGEENKVWIGIFGINEGVKVFIVFLRIYVRYVGIKVSWIELGIWVLVLVLGFMELFGMREF